MAVVLRAGGIQEGVKLMETVADQHIAHVATSVNVTADVDAGVGVAHR